MVFQQNLEKYILINCREKLDKMMEYVNQKECPCYYIII